MNLWHAKIDQFSLAICYEVRIRDVYSAAAKPSERCPRAGDVSSAVFVRWTHHIRDKPEVLFPIQGLPVALQLVASELYRNKTFKELIACRITNNMPFEFPSESF